MEKAIKHTLLICFAEALKNRWKKTLRTINSGITAQFVTNLQQELYNILRKFNKILYKMFSAPAVANAVFNAVGVRIRNLSITPEKVLRGIKHI